MAFAIGGAGALLKAFIPTFSGLTARLSAAGTAPWGANKPVAMLSPAPVVLSPEAEAALAPLGLPPDGPIDPDAAPRARLTPDVAARNFVLWAQALDLAGAYGTRSVYALYCEFSEVDGRPPLRDTRFLEALARTEGVATVARGKDKGCRLWRWTIEPAQLAPVAGAVDADASEETAADVWTHEPAPAPRRAPEAAASASAPSPEPKPVASDAAAGVAAPSKSQPATKSSPVPEPVRTAQASPSAVAARQPKRAPAPSRAPEVTSPAVPQATAAPVPPAKAATPALVPTRAPETQTSAGAMASASASTSMKPVKSSIILPRFVADTEHPFSPAGLREREKSMRRLRLNAAASRKQRGALRRAA